MKLTYALLRKQRTRNLRYILRTLLMKLAPDFIAWSVSLASLSHAWPSGYRTFYA